MADILIIGSGIAAYTSALELSHAGHSVYILSKEDHIGGKIADFSKDTNSCPFVENQTIAALYLGGSIHASATILSSLYLQVINNPSIKLISNSKLVSSLEKTDSFEVKIDLNKQKEISLNVEAILLAQGFEIFDPTEKGEYGYSYYKNVITSTEYEKLLFESKQSLKPLTRPSDKKKIEKIAFIQCVGSRDTTTNSEFCSSICCMYSAKEVILTKEYENKVDIAVFYLDLRECSKNFYSLTEKAQQLNARYIKSMISTVKEDPITENLSIKYLQENIIQEENFDLVVLATGVRANQDNKSLAEILKIELDEFDFIKTSPLNPTATNRKGIFTISSSEKKALEVAETMALVSTATNKINKFLSSEKIITKPRPEKENIQQNIGVFVCKNALNTLNIDDEIIKELKNIPDVSHVFIDEKICTPEKISSFQKNIEEHDLTNILIAPCTLKPALNMFRQKAAEKGINSALVDSIDIFNLYLAKNNDILKFISNTKKAITNLKNSKPLRYNAAPVIQKALIIGASFSGLIAALKLAEKNIPTIIIEKTDYIGGYVFKNKDYIFSAQENEFAANLLEKIKENEFIEIITEAKLISFKGRQGYFKCDILLKDQSIKKHECGAVIVSTGTESFIPNEYLYGKNSNILTLNDALPLINDVSFTNENKIYVFIQCVGSRDNNKPYCSRSCCLDSIKNAIKIKERNPETSIYIIAKTIQTPGQLELEYKKARKLGIIFIFYTDDKKPIIEEQNEKLSLTVFDHVLNKNIEIYSDKVILASAQIPSADAKELADILNIQADKYGFLSETHGEFHTIASPLGGIFVAGSAHEIKTVTDCISHATYIANRALRLLVKPYILLGFTTADVDTDKCAACLTCVRQCPYNVPQISRDKKEMGAAYIDPTECRGCGICTAKCPNKAISLHSYEDEKIFQMINKALEEGSYETTF
ncbi:FAD-dependent oxidoreductase [Selenomonadales bacterium OttesenSCG-928-I06]|nr:FAD-dependent oxidoreductase [Selenomonadales bacterium OttesenSCG-928-I06]